MTLVYFAPFLANDTLKVLYSLKLTVIGINPIYENSSKILHRINSRGPLQSVDIIIFKSSLGASTGVDCGILLLESEPSAWKTLYTRD
uniref:Helicase C-terminal domain-containing protein n=1 Tax=Heterorhabditis bacteriophora TaxID=37862 RepID=A0A1I7XMM3_HETBA